MDDWILSLPDIPWNWVAAGCVGILVACSIWPKKDDWEYEPETETVTDLIDYLRGCADKLETEADRLEAK